MLVRPSVCFAPEGNSGTASGTGVTETAPSSAPATSSSPSSTPSGASTPPTPSSSSPSTPSTSPTDSSSQTEDAGFGEDFFSPLSEIEVADAPTAPVVEPVADKVPKPVETKTEAAPQTPVSEPPQPEASKQIAEPAAGGADTSIPLHEPGRLADAMRQNQAALVERLAESYKLSPEEVEALEADATTTVPKLFARLHFNVMASVLQNMQAMVPAMQQQSMSVYQSAQQNLDKFFSAWPQLDKVKHRDAVLEVAKQYRAMNPKVSGEQMIADVGAFVALKVKVPLIQAASQVGTVQGGVRPPPASPFVPAGNGVTSPPPKTDTNEWDGLYEDR